MINIEKALELFSKQYRKRYGEERKFEPGETAVAILKNCAMIVMLEEDGTLGIKFTGAKPFVIDESLDMYQGD